MTLGTSDHFSPRRPSPLGRITESGELRTEPQELAASGLRNAKLAGAMSGGRRARAGTPAVDQRTQGARRKNESHGNLRYLLRALPQLARLAGRHHRKSARD